MRKFLLAFGLVSATTAVTSVASAAPCKDLEAGPIPVIYIENGDTQEPLIKRLGQQLVNSSTPLRIIYKNEPTCTLRNDFFKATDDLRKMNKDTARVTRYIPDATEAAMIGWDPSKAPPTCDLDIDTNDSTLTTNPLGLAIGATYLSSCPAATQPGDVTVVTGPVQSYGFVVPPTGSSQIAITAEEGFFAFGYADATGQATPWLDQNLRFIRAATASTALTLASAINLPAAKLKGVIPTNNTSGEVVTLVNGSPTPEATIGLLGTEVFDADRSQVKLLAFKGFGQRYAYYPDKTSASFDKQNVRDGHYLPWAPTPYIATVEGSNIKNLNAKRIIDLIVNLHDETGTNAVKGIDSVIASGLVPECAMKVQRAFDGAELALYSPTEPCGCYFEAKVPQGSTKCSTCTDDSTCGGGKCRRGYCEAK